MHPAAAAAVALLKWGKEYAKKDFSVPVASNRSVCRVTTATQRVYRQVLAVDSVRWDTTAPPGPSTRRLIDAHRVDTELPKDYPIAHAVVHAFLAIIATKGPPLRPNLNVLCCK